MSVAENPIQIALGRAFDGFAVVAPIGTDERPEMPRFELQTPSRSYVVRAIWAGAGWPADVQRAIRAVEGDWPQDLIVVGRQLSTGSRELLERRGANWVDGSGQARIIGKDILVIREAADSAVGLRDAQQFAWSPSAVSIAEALLSRTWTSGIGTADLANITEWSPTQVSQVLQAFDAQAWTTKWGPQRGPTSRRELADVNGLLDAWALEISRDQRPRRFAERTMGDPIAFLRAELGPALDKHVRWAVTGWAAAEQLASFATIVPSLQIYVSEEGFTGALTQAMAETPVRDVTGGGRIEFRSAAPRLFRLVSRSSQLPLVTPARVFADLRSLGGRGEDAAVHLRDEVIIPKLRAGSRRRPSSDLVEWDRTCRHRLEQRVKHELDDVPTVYAAGTWSVGYAATGSQLSLTDLKVGLDETRGQETGWPPWWVPTRKGIRPEVRDGGIECWLKENALREAGHADYWRAEPGVRLFLLRGYQEDEIVGEPGTTLDLTLPIWRVGESLLHASRMARYVSAPTIRFLVRWTGLEGRELRTITGSDRLLPPGRVAHQDTLSTYIQTAPDEIHARLPSLVEALVSPLYELFDFFLPPLSLYVDELTAMQERRLSS